MNDDATVNGLVLAGGKSRRMGRDKALLARDGESQLGRAVRLLSGCVGRVYVSVREEQSDEPERARFDCIVDRYFDIGPIAGILSAMDFDPSAAWLVLACDLPNVDTGTLDALLAGRDTTRPFTAFTSSHDALPEPLCAIFEPAARPLMERFVADGIVCPRKMLIRSNTQLLTQPHPAALDNINTPDDLARITPSAAQ